LKFILSNPHCPDDLNENDSNGRSILDYACEYNNIPVVSELLSYNVDVNVKAADGYTPLHVSFFLSINVLF
jgi:ankyrin repeat protein